MSSQPVPHHVLAVDVGNSRFKFGLFDASRWLRGERVLPEPLETLAVPLSQPVPWSTLERWTRSHAVVSTVAGANPAGVERLLAEWPSTLQPQPCVLRDVARFPIRVDVDQPRRVGVDRVLNAVAVNELRAPDQPAVVVDSGTATTVDYVRADGAFAGGAILPGLRLAARSLHDYTALLPLVELDELRHGPVPVVGRNTTAAIRSGLYWGQLGAVKELVDRMRRLAEAEGQRPPLVVLTGGGSAVLHRELPQTRLELSLSLQGLVLVVLRTQSGQPDDGPDSGAVGAADGKP